MAKYPLLSFGHGYGGKIDTALEPLPHNGSTAGGADLQPYYHKLLYDIASAGFVVVAAASCPRDFCTKTMSTDMAYTLEACHTNSSLHPALAMVNRSLKTGLFGKHIGSVCSLASCRLKVAPATVPQVTPWEHSVPLGLQ